MNKRANLRKEKCKICLTEQSLALLQATLPYGKPDKMIN
jgi:hypothetical protein